MTDKIKQFEINKDKNSTSEEKIPEVTLDDMYATCSCDSKELFNQLNAAYTMRFLNKVYNKTKQR